MKIISTRAHGMLDYIAGLLLIAFPWLTGNGSTGAESLVPTLLGVLTITSASMTDYENSLVNIIPMRWHLLLDAGMAAFLAASPWLFGFQDKNYLPFVLFAGLEIIVVLCSRVTRAPGTDRENLI